MPHTIPPEIQILIESYQHGIPVVVVMSRESPLIPLPLHSRYAYAYMGYFRLADLNVSAPPLRPALVDILTAIRSQRVLLQSPSQMNLTVWFTGA